MFFVHELLDDAVYVVDTVDDVKDYVSIPFVCKLKMVCGVTDGVRVFRQWECIKEDLLRMSVLGLSCKATIEGMAYVSCDDNEATFVKVPYGIDVISTGAFRGLKTLKNVQLPSTVLRISMLAFAETGLERIVVPESVVDIQYGAFRSSDVQEVEIQGKITCIAESTFSFCRNLRSLILPDSIERIGFAFIQCVSLRRIVIPAKGEILLGEGVFAHCPNLVIECYEGSFIDRYAKNRNLNVKYIEA